MRRNFAGLTALALTALVFGAGEARAQQGVLTGVITDQGTGQPLEGAQVSVLGGPAGVGGLTDGAGRYRIQLAAGTYDIGVTYVGYRVHRIDGVDITAGQTTTQDITMTSMALEMDPMVVTTSRGTQEKSTEAPNMSFTISDVEIQEMPATTPTDYLKTAPGVDIISHGIQASNVVVRGFNNIFSGALHTLTDYRLAGMPSLRVNLLHFIPSNELDIDRVEVVLGPGSALYGPNTANGVLHFITKSPLDSQGTTISLGAGERSVFQGSFRSAFLLSDDFGFKVSGQYIRGSEWEYTDPAEESARLQAAADPAACVDDKELRGLSAADGAFACSQIGIRNYDLERYGLEARADYRFADDGMFVATYGRTSATGIELTGLGAGQTTDWIYDFWQARLSKGRFFTQGYYNTSNAGGTYLLRSGLPLVDESTLLVGQVQHGLALMDGRQDFTYGFDYFATRPETGGTINGSYEAEDDIDEWGAYIQSKTAVSDQLDLILAGRVDDHSILPDRVFSPRAALVIKPVDGQSFRLTYNRAFSTPSSLNYFLDISGGAAPPPLGSLGYTTRAFGTGRTGFGFEGHGPGGSQWGMRSPFYPGGASTLLPATTGVMWDLALGVLQAQVAAGQLPASLGSILPILAALDPTESDIQVMGLDLTQSSPSPVPLSSMNIQDVPVINESNTETYEVGWEGIFQNRFRFAADVYYMKKNDFVSPLLIQTPLLTLNGQDIAAYVAAPIVTALTQAYIGGGMDAATALATAQATAAAVIPGLATGMASIPVGVLSSDQVAAQGADIIVTYRNVGDIELWGADLAMEWFIDDNWTMSGTYSHISKDYFAIADGAPIALNAPRHKGSLGLAYRDVLTGFNAGLRMRYTDEFPAVSADYVGTGCLPGVTVGGFIEDCVQAATVVDLNLGYKVPNTQATFQVMVNNVFDSDYRPFVGVPTMGRLAMVRVKYDIF